MELNLFNRLPLDQKTTYMWDNGICLAQRIVENRYILCIFELDGFFVEAIYSRRNNRVNAILPIARWIKVAFGQPELAIAKDKPSFRRVISLEAL